MGVKRTYSVRLDDEQRQQLEARAGGKLAVGNLIRCAIDNFLRQEEEKDYLSDVEARIAATINRLARQVEKDRAEQQLVIGVLDGLREWLAFTLPSPSDKVAAHALMQERNRLFFEQLPLRFESQSRAKITTYMDAHGHAAPLCPKCETGVLRQREGSKGRFWYCSNWKAMPKCSATFKDDNGQPVLVQIAASGK